MRRSDPDEESYYLECGHQYYLKWDQAFPGSLNVIGAVP